VTKATVTRLFIGSVIAVIAGLVLGFVAILAAAASGSFVMHGPDVVGFDPTPFALSMIGIAALALLTVIGGAIGGLVAWIGALINTSQLEDKAWFVVLLILGLFSFGFIAMIAYVIAGPDGTTHSSPIRPAA
jgi:hypothetical protein